MSIILKQLTRRNAFKLGVLSLGAFALFGCSDIADDEHYKSPDWLKGNAYEVLQKDGNYKTFLRGVDLSGYKRVVDGNSIVTVAAPNDEAFASFLQKKGYGSIDDLYAKDPQYLTKLINYHVMYYAFDWNKMVNFRPSEGDGASDEQKGVNAGYYYKHRTYSQDPIEEVRVRFTANATSDTLLHLYHYERYLPVLSNKLFETKGIDADYNYKYFFPNSTWNSGGAMGYFNIANGRVTDETAVVTDNGYLYHVDQVIEPLNTIYDELKNDADYSQFLSIYDKYSTYELADDETNANLGYQAYIHRHGSLPAIACEWPSTSYLQINQLEKDGYNLFVPSNKAIEDFFKTYWTADGGYSSLEGLDGKILEYFIMQSFSKDNFISFPEEIKNGKVLTVYGTEVNVNPDEVTDRRMCANGVLYGMDHMDAPAIFSSVVGPAFKDTTYMDYLYALDGSELVLSLASNKSKFVTLMPKNAQFAATDPAMRLYTTTTGKELQQYSSEAGDFVALGSGAMRDIVNIHTATNVASLPSSGTAVIETNTAYNYWFIDNGRITTNALFNEQLEPTYDGDPFVAFHPIQNNGKNWDNGSSYSYDAEAIFQPASGDGLARRLAVCNDKNFSYYMFAQLLQKAGLTEGNALSNSILPTEDTRFICFVPTNDAIIANLTDIPGCSKLSVKDGTLDGSVTGTNKNQLAAYLRSYFITSTMNSFTSYPYLGSSCKGEFYTTGTEKMQIEDNGAALSVRFNAEGSTFVQVNNQYHYLPFAFSDGCFHLIDGVLK